MASCYATGLFNSTDFNVVDGNLIGTDITGSAPLGNHGNGIALSGARVFSNPIGENVIAFNGNDGVLVDAANAISIRANSVFASGHLGIELVNNGNHNQPAPVLTAAAIDGGSITVQGTLSAAANKNFALDLFANATANASGFGEGQYFLGSVPVTTDASGQAGFSLAFTTPLPAGQTTVSATATNLTSGDTSQFSRDFSVPVAGQITGPLAPVTVNAAVSVSASFTDASTFTTHTAVWDWGDGSSSPGTVTETSGSGTVSGCHPYTAGGIYTITLTVTNDVGGFGQSVFQYVVVYNPEAGFVTGGGWITSPAVAYAANPALTGHASFGFNAQYHNGDTVPAGSTEFQFPAANLNFHATGYDWLVITTHQAQYQGSGTINGAGNYGFLVTALDGGGHGADRLRIKFWDKNNNNAVVYDTQPGAPTTAAPTTPLGGGRIQVHTNAQLAAGGLPSGDVAPLTAGELQPVVREAIGRWAAAGIDSQQVNALHQVTVGIAAFPRPWLGMAFPGAVWIDQDAAGHGWYLEASPASDAVFPAVPGSPASGKMDLLTVVAHELGHELGLEDTDGAGLMGIWLPTGTRRLPGAEPKEDTVARQAPGTPPVAAMAGLAEPGSGMALGHLPAGEVSLNVPAGNILPGRTATTGWTALGGLSPGAADAPARVLSTPRLSLSAGMEGVASQPATAGNQAATADVLDCVFAGTSVSRFGDGLAWSEFG
jgi:PKD repeat protein